VQRFSSEGEFLLFWQMPETKRGNPKGLAVDTDGNILVTEPHYCRVNLFTPEGRLLAQWGEQGTNAGQLSFPRAAVVNSRGDLVVCEFQMVERVQRFTLEQLAEGGIGARFMSSFGSRGSGPGEFNRAEGLFIDDQDHVLVADACNHRIQVFDAEGRFLRQFGRAGNAAGELSYPYDVCVDGEGRHYVCEFGNSRVQIFDAAGTSLEILGGPGAVPGMFNNPWGVALDSQGNLYVADSQNHRVQKFIKKSKGTRLRRESAARQEVPKAVEAAHRFDGDFSAWTEVLRDAVPRSVSTAAGPRLCEPQQPACVETAHRFDGELPAWTEVLRDAVPRSVSTAAGPRLCEPQQPACVEAAHRFDGELPVWTEVLRDAVPRSVSSPPGPRAKDERSTPPSACGILHSALCTLHS
jgi:sugar lactone lactonase YvrE